MGVQGVHERHGLVLRGHVQHIWPHGILVDAVDLPIDLMKVIGVFVDPVGVQGSQNYSNLLNMSTEIREINHLLIWQYCPNSKGHDIKHDIKNVFLEYNQLNIFAKFSHLFTYFNHSNTGARFWSSSIRYRRLFSFCKDNDKWVQKTKISLYKWAHWLHWNFHKALPVRETLGGALVRFNAI